MTRNTVSIAGIVDGMALDAAEAEAIAQLLDIAIVQPMPATAELLRGRARMRELANVLRGKRRDGSKLEGNR